MSWRLHHEWTRGAVVNGAQLEVCEHCATLRVTRPGELSFVNGVRVLRMVVHHIRRLAEPEDRIRAEAPPCVSPAVHFRAPW